MISHIFLLLNSGVPYMVTCNVSQFKENRITNFNARISDTDQLGFSIGHSTEFECFYLFSTYVLCQSGLCSCDMDGLATHWTYRTPADLSSPVTFRCTTNDNDGVLQTSTPWTSIVHDGTGSSISFNPADESFTKFLGQSPGPIVCSAQCNPACQFRWINPDETVVDGPNLEIPSLSKNDHGKCTCHAGNGYGNNAKMNLIVTVNCVYILSGFPEHVVLGDNVTVILTCVTDDSFSFKFVTWTKNSIRIANIKDDCVFTSIPDTTYTYTCDPDNNIYNLTIPPDAITDGIQNVVWRCLQVVGQGSNGWNLAIAVPVTGVRITPSNDNNILDIIGEEQATVVLLFDKML